MSTWSHLTIYASGSDHFEYKPVFYCLADFEKVNFVCYKQTLKNFLVALSKYMSQIVIDVSIANVYMNRYRLRGS